MKYDVFGFFCLYHYRMLVTLKLSLFQCVCMLPLLCTKSPISHLRVHVCYISPIKLLTYLLTYIFRTRGPATNSE